MARVVLIRSMGTQPRVVSLYLCLGALANLIYCLGLFANFYLAAMYCEILVKSGEWYGWFAMGS